MLLKMGLAVYGLFLIFTITVTYGLRIFENEGFANFAKAIGTHKPYTAPHPYFFYVDLICNSWFTLELVSCSYLKFRWKIPFILS